MAEGSGDKSAAEADFQRELAARRKDLEREFQDKQRDLKAQHQRRMDALERDRADWEAHRRDQQKQLADQAEKLRRNTQNTETKVKVTADNLRELDELRAQVKELERGERQAKRTQADLEAAVAAAERRRASDRLIRIWTAAVVAVIALGYWFVMR